ncbi:MAG: aspartate-semialdehyde dehydrogenase [Deltaproteobacteria bacterium]|nr:aspartate-semialdehyde dehydrogenase [Deltaproteobacteria bacterium]
MKKPIHLALVGATGAVGREVLSILEHKNLHLEKFSLFASERSEGVKIPFQEKMLSVERLVPEVFERNIDYAIFSAGKTLAQEFAPIALRNGITVIDNSSAFRMDERIPLVVPEVNAHTLNRKEPEIIANPNCSTIQLVMVLKPLEKYRIKRVVVSTYQAHSGAGHKAQEELRTQTTDFLKRLSFLQLTESNSGNPQSEATLMKNVFSHQIAFNCIPHIDQFDESGYTFEEIKVINETRKIMGLPELKITCTAVRVPVLDSHSESVNIEFESAFKLEDIKNDLGAFPGVKVLDNPKAHVYPLNVEARGRDEVFVGRIRRDPSLNSGLNMWVVSDNLRKGAALNAVQILETLLTS